MSAFLAKQEELSLTTPIMENQLEKQMNKHMETGVR